VRDRCEASSGTKQEAAFRRPQTAVKPPSTASTARPPARRRAVRCLARGTPGF
jgi:hypothetical protein